MKVSEMKLLQRCSSSLEASWNFETHAPIYILYKATMPYSGTAKEVSGVQDRSVVMENDRNNKMGGFRDDFYAHLWGCIFPNEYMLFKSHV